jgi:hypothetical protein
MVLTFLAVAPRTDVQAAESVASLPPAGVRIDGNPIEWLDRLPQLTPTSAAPAIRPARIWLAESEEGLIIAGQAGGPPPVFAVSATDLATADHLVLSVTLVDDLPLPKVGWSNPVGPVELDSAEDCARLDDLADDPLAVAECKRWYAAQLAYRQAFRRLFTRQWQLAPGMVAETLAQPAFIGLAPPAREGLHPLAPRGRPIARFATVAGSGYGFEILLPWEALPPASGLELGKLNLKLDAVAAQPAPVAGQHSTKPATADRQSEVPPAGYPVRLDPPRRWRIGPCDYPLEAADAWNQRWLPAFFLPSAGAEIGEIFIIENQTTETRTDFEAISPVVVATRVFSREIAPAVVVCGPSLAVRRGEVRTLHRSLTVRPGFKVKALADGWLLVDGPYSGITGRVAGGSCGACPTISLDVLFLPKATTGLPGLAFSDAWAIEGDDMEPGGSRDARVFIDGDLTTVTAWEADVADTGGRLVWTRVRHCYDAAIQAFKECGRHTDSSPPVDVGRPPDEPRL